jgi:hypothetical protein
MYGARDMDGAWPRLDALASPLQLSTYLALIISSVKDAWIHKTATAHAHAR